MALTDLWLTLPDASQCAITVSQLIMDAENEKAAFILQLPRSGTIDAIAWESGNVVQCTNGLTIGIQTVDANGDPTGSAYGGMVAGTEGTVAAQTQFVTSLGTQATATAGDWVAIVFEFTTWAVGNDTDIRCHQGYQAGGTIRHPYVNLYTGAWAPTANVAPVCALEYNTTTYYSIGGVAPADIDSIAFNSSDGTNERGNRFQVPVGVRVAGIWALIDVDAGDDFELVLYSGDQGTEVVEATLAVDGDYSSSAIAGTRQHLFAAPVTLAADTQYRIAIKPGATDIIAYSQTAASVAMMDAYPLGANCYGTSRTYSAGGAWTDATTTVYAVGIVVDQVDVGGSSSMKSNRGMTGGING